MQLQRAKVVPGQVEEEVFLVVVEVGGLVDQVPRLLELKGLEDPLFLLLNGRELKWQKK